MEDRKTLVPFYLIAWLTNSADDRVRRAARDLINPTAGTSVQGLAWPAYLELLAHAWQLLPRDDFRLNAIALLDQFPIAGESILAPHLQTPGDGLLRLIGPMGVLIQGLPIETRIVRQQQGFLHVQVSSSHATDTFFEMLGDQVQALVERQPLRRGWVLSRVSQTALDVEVRWNTGGLLPDALRRWCQLLIDGSGLLHSLDDANAYARKLANLNTTLQLQLQEERQQRKRLASSLDDANSLEPTRELAEANLRDAEARLDWLQAQTGHNLALLDEENSILHASDTLANLCGVDRAQLVGIPISRLLPDALSEPHSLPETSLPTRFAAHLIGPEHTPIPVEVTIAEVRKARLCLIEDRRREQARSAQTDKLEEQVRRAHKTALTGQLAAGTAHDLNNLLAMISVETDPGRLAELVSDARHLTQSLLDFGRERELDITSVDLPELGLRLKQLVSHVIPDRIQLEVARTPVHARADVSRLQQVLTNLVLNARDAIDDDGYIGIAFSIEGAEAVITVSDNGRGMDTMTRSRIFEPLFSTKGDAGTGLGLAISQQIIEELAGSIVVRSHPGEGSTFVIRLPLARRPTVASTRRTGIDSTKSMTHTRGS